jgi:hypothetical protein
MPDLRDQAVENAPSPDESPPVGQVCPTYDIGLLKTHLRPMNRLAYKR